MVKMPRKVKRYSPAAGKHTEHTVERVKKRRASELKWGQRRFHGSLLGTEVSQGQSHPGRNPPRGLISFTDVAKRGRHIPPEERELENLS